MTSARDSIALTIHKHSVLSLAYSLDVADAIIEQDPLRLALREPSDELIERLCALAGAAMSQEHEEFTRAVLAALAEAVTPDEQ